MLEVNIGKLTMDSTLRFGRPRVSPRHVWKSWRRWRGMTYAHTCEPCSGMIVKRTSPSLSRTHATLPIEVRDATNSRRATRKIRLRVGAGE